MTTLLILCFISIAFHLYHQHVLNKPLPAPKPIPFEGDIFSVGETVFAIRNQGADTSKTIICFPGFTETIAYFVDLYKDENCQVIFVNNSFYHSPFNLNKVKKMNWETNPYEPATIEHDGFYLARIIKEFSSNSNIFIHGHSRGGAVVLDAGRQFPEITRPQDKTVTAILEAAVVPKGTSLGMSTSKIGNAISAYLLPIFFNYYSKSSQESLEKTAMMNPTNRLKNSIMMGNLRSPKFYWVYLTNVINITTWQEEQTYTLYQNFHRVILLQGERDDVLVNKTMEASALEGEKLNDQVRIVKTKNTNHFITLEQPKYIKEVINPG
jgi:pimeloyl-ACP methyl ester carboxylesterase